MTLVCEWTGRGSNTTHGPAVTWFRGERVCRSCLHELATAWEEEEQRQRAIRIAPDNFWDEDGGFVCPAD